MFSVATSIPRYTTNDEYRAIFKQLFEIPVEEEDDQDTVALIFENADINDKLDYIYEKTKDNAKFSELYRIGAGKLLSEDMTIGVAILFSFDYMYLFYKMLSIYLGDASVAACGGDDETIDELHTQLKQILSS